MERKTKGSFRSDSLTNLSCELDWCYLASFWKDDAYKYNKMDMKYRKWIVFLLQGPTRNIHALWLWLIQNISCLSNSINIHTSFVLWALFNDLIIVYAPSTQLHPFKSMFMQLVYKITRYLGFKGWVIFSHRTLVVTELYLLEAYSPHKIWKIQYIHSLLSFK